MIVHRALHKLHLFRLLRLRRTRRRCGPCARWGRARWPGGPAAAHCVAQLLHWESVSALAVAEEGQLVSGSNTAKLCIWTLGADANVATLVSRGVGLAPLPGGRIAAADPLARLVEVWDLAAGARVAQIHTGEFAAAAALTKTTRFACGRCARPAAPRTAMPLTKWRATL